MMKNMTKAPVKETIVELLRKEGYDFITACEIANNTIKEFKNSGKKKARYVFKSGTSITLQKED